MEERCSAGQFGFDAMAFMSSFASGVPQGISPSITILSRASAGHSGSCAALILSSIFLLAASLLKSCIVYVFREMICLIKMNIIPAPVSHPASLRSPHPYPGRHTCRNRRALIFLSPLSSDYHYLPLRFPAVSLSDSLDFSRRLGFTSSAFILVDTSMAKTKSTPLRSTGANRTPI